MADWQTISSLATAGGTLVLGVATFWAVRSSNRSARIAEQALLTGMRPLLLNSLFSDPTHKVLWSDRHAVHLAGGHAVFETDGGVIYLAMALRNVGAGIALLHGWHTRGKPFMTEPPADIADFRRLTIDLYIPPGGTGYWEGAVRDADDDLRPDLLRAIDQREPIGIDILYGDQEGGQRTISRFNIFPGRDEGWFCPAGRHWQIDRPAPR